MDLFIDESYWSSREATAASFCNSVGAEMERMIKNSGKSVDKLAEDLDISTDRLVEILESDGNLRASTLAKIAHACGYSPKLVFEKS